MFTQGVSLIIPCVCMHAIDPFIIAKWLVQVYTTPNHFILLGNVG
jgi:hypothetical protein